MSIYGTVRVPLAPEDWMKCEECKGEGSYPTPAGLRKKCKAIGCEDGVVRTKVVRASKTSIQDAEEEKRKRERDQ